MDATRTKRQRHRTQDFRNKCPAQTVDRTTCYGTKLIRWVDARSCTILWHFLYRPAALDWLSIAQEVIIALEFRFLFISRCGVDVRRHTRTLEFNIMRNNRKWRTILRSRRWREGKKHKMNQLCMRASGAIRYFAAHIWTQPETPHIHYTCYCSTPLHALESHTHAQVVLLHSGSGRYVCPHIGKTNYLLSIDLRRVIRRTCSLVRVLVYLTSGNVRRREKIA